MKPVDERCAEAPARVLEALASEDCATVEAAVETCRQQVRAGRAALASLRTTLACARAALQAVQAHPTPASARELDRVLGEGLAHLRAARAAARPVPLEELRGVRQWLYPGALRSLRPRRLVLELHAAIPERLTLRDAAVYALILALPWLL